jgi:nitrite reductase (NO-forming)
MRTISSRLIALSAALILAGCASGTPSWTLAPAAPEASAPAPSAMDMPSSSAVASAKDSISIEAFDLGFKPASVSVESPGSYAVMFHNTGSTLHDLTFADGTKLTADPGAMAEGTVKVPASGLSFKCSIPGHAEAGMTGAISVTGAPTAVGSPTLSVPAQANAAPSPDPNAPAYVRFDPTAPTLLPGTTHDIDLPIVDKEITVATGFVVHAWTFGGQVPAPTIRVHLGDTVRLHLTNRTSMSHSIDFHASQTAMNHQMVEIKPGATFTYTFTADYAGVWMYHCGTTPTLHHIANGMYGMVIVEPKGGLPAVDHEIALVQSEWYLAGQKEPVSLAKASAGNPSPDFVVFNGVANQYKDGPIEVGTKTRVRVFILDAGPNIDSSFHVVGTIFDTVIKEGVTLSRGNAGGWGSQAVDLSPAQGAIIEFSPQEDGMYPLVTHAFNFVGRGAVGIFMAGDGNPSN